MPYPNVSQLPLPPQRGDDFATFTARANTHAAALTPFTTQVNEAGAYIEQRAADSEEAQGAAESARDVAIEARDVTTGARDTTVQARDVTVQARDVTVATQEDFSNKWQGVYLAPPTLRPDGTPLQEGDAYTDGNTGAINIYLSGAWDAVTGYTRRTSPTGSAIIPAGTTAQRDPAPGADKLLRFNTETGLFEGFNGTGWLPVGSGATGGGGDQVFVENDSTVTNDYTLTRNAMSVGPITISDTATVTVNDTARWVIL